MALVLIRTKEEGVGMEDLDKLQLELETLLSAVAVRIRELNSEITTLSTAEERKDKKGKLAITPTVTVTFIHFINFIILFYIVNTTFNWIYFR